MGTDFCPRKMDATYFYARFQVVAQERAADSEGDFRGLILKALH